MHAEGTMFIKNNLLSAAICFTFVLDALSQDTDILQISAESCRFEIHTSSLTWNKARQACQQRHMTLASLSDTREAKSLSNLVKQADKMYSQQYSLDKRNYWMGLGKQNSDYYWVDGGSSHGVRNTFTEITNYEDAEGCGYINSGATVSMTQCDVSKGFICEHTNGTGACYTTLSTTISPMGYDETTAQTYLKCASKCLTFESCAGVFVTLPDLCILLTYETNLPFSLADTQIQMTHFYHRRLIYLSTYQAFDTSYHRSNSPTPSVIDTTRIEEQTMGEGINPTTSWKPTTDAPNTTNDVLEGTYNKSSTINDNVTTESTTDYTNSHSDTERSGSPNDHVTTNSINDVTSNQSDTEGSGSQPDHRTTNNNYDVTDNLSETEGSGEHHTNLNEINTFSNHFSPGNIPDETISIVTPNEQLSTSFDVTTTTCIDNDGVTPSCISDGMSTVEDHFSLSISTYRLSSLMSNSLVKDIQVSNYSRNTPTEKASTESLSEGTNAIHNQVTIYSSYGIGTSIDQTDNTIDGTNIFTDQVVTTSSYDTKTLSSTSEIAIISSSGVISNVDNQASIGMTSANYVTIPSSSVGGSDQVTTDTSVVEVTTLSIQDTTYHTSTDQTYSIGNPSHGTSAQFTYPLENSTLCECICRESDETLEEKLQRITSELAINKRSLSSAVRKRVSASDPRPSARYVGYLGVAIILIFVGTIVCFDIPRFVGFVRGCMTNINRKQKKYNQAVLI